MSQPRSKGSMLQRRKARDATLRKIAEELVDGFYTLTTCRIHHEYSSHTGAVRRDSRKERLKQRLEDKPGAKLGNKSLDKLRDKLGPAKHTKRLGDKCQLVWRNIIKEEKDQEEELRLGRGLGTRVPAPWSDMVENVAREIGIHHRLLRSLIQSFGRWRVREEYSLSHEDYVLECYWTGLAERLAMDKAVIEVLIVRELVRRRQSEASNRTTTTTTTTDTIDRIKGCLSWLCPSDNTAPPPRREGLEYLRALLISIEEIKAHWFDYIEIVCRDGKLIFVFGISKHAHQAEFEAATEGRLHRSVSVFSSRCSSV